MKTILKFVLLFGMVLFYGCTSLTMPKPDLKLLEQKPEFYNFEWIKGTQLTKKATDLNIKVDSVGKQPLFVLVDETNLPVLYTANISTPVCADGECKFMHIKMYWSLLGSYVGFDRFSKLPLTKHDHDYFTKKDYQKLHNLLLDKNSILERRKINELVKSPQELKNEGIDALSGATITEVKESVVSGALYSCYVAWHLAHGKVASAIKKQTINTANWSLWKSMLYSSNKEYQMVALQNINSIQYQENYNRITDIFVTSTPLVRTFIVKKSPDIFWSSLSLQQPLWNNFSETDINTRSLMLDKLKHSSIKIIQDLSAELDVMTRNQLKVYLSKLPIEFKENTFIMKNLNAHISYNPLGYIVKEFLEELE